uniref:Uncharacterized protein n=1 Tax=Kalmanozyma brasiliensis (strain GHG001) TaxID=1365824 RepID=V5E5U3_KALBG
MTTAASSSTYGESILSPSTTTSFASSSAYPISSATLSGADHLRDLFHRRIRSLVHLKRSLQGQRTWHSTVQLQPPDLATAFDNDRMHRRTLRYSLLGFSLSSILDISNPADMARAIISLINELDSYTDDNIIALTSGTGAANFGTQRPKMRNLFKSGKQALKRSAAAQAISEFGTDSNVGSTSAGANSEQASYLMAPNIPFQLDFFQTFFTLCDLLTEVYYKMISFLPRDAATDGAGEARTSSPPTSAGPAGQDQDKPGMPNLALSDLYGESAVGTGIGISVMTMDLLLKADAKIKKTISVQVKDVDGLARQTIKDELASLDPLMKDLGIDTGAVNAAFQSLPSHFRRGTVKPDPRTSSHDASAGHHHLNLTSLASSGGASVNGNGSTDSGSLIRSQSGRIRRMMSGERAEDTSVPVYPAAAVSPIKDA